MPDRFNRKSSGDEKALMRRIRKEAEAVERRLEALTVAFLVRARTQKRSEPNWNRTMPTTS